MLDNTGSSRVQRLKVQAVQVARKQSIGQATRVNSEASASWGKSHGEDHAWLMTPSTPTVSDVDME